MRQQAAQHHEHYYKEYTGVKVQHIDKFSFDPAITRGNIENFTGVAQIPIGFAADQLVSAGARTSRLVLMGAPGNDEDPPAHEAADRRHGRDRAGRHRHPPRRC